MISPEVGKAWFQIIIFILLLSGGLLFMLEPGTAAFVIDVITFAIGLIFLSILWLVIRKSLK